MKPTGHTSIGAFNRRIVPAALAAALVLMGGTALAGCDDVNGQQGTEIENGQTDTSGTGVEEPGGGTTTVDEQDPENEVNPNLPTAAQCDAWYDYTIKEITEGGLVITPLSVDELPDKIVQEADFISPKGVVVANGTCKVFYRDSSDALSATSVDIEVIKANY
jgi:hypothetical protein